jgi:flagellar motor protein MotB
MARYKLKKSPTQSTWMLSFIDLITLMLTFFVLIFATQKPDDMAWQQTQQSFQSAFKGVGGQINQAPRKTDDQQDATKQFTDDTSAGLDIEYLTGILTKAWAQDPQLAQMPFEIIAKPFATYLRLPLATWQNAATATRRANILVPLLNRLENNVVVVARLPQQDVGLVEAQKVVDALKAAGYNKNISSEAELAPNSSFIDVVLTFNAQ